MRLFHSPVSSNARRAVMTAVHLGTPIDLVLVDLAKGEQRKPDYLKMNPMGRVPTLLAGGGFILTESHAIMQYLADLTPGQTVYPTELRARADVNRWMFWNANHFSPAVSVLGWERVVKRILAMGEPDPREVARGERLVTELANVLDAHLAGRQWICGTSLSLADLAIATPLMVTVPAQLPVLGHQNIQAWFERVRGLEAWKKTEPSRGPVADRAAGG